MFEAHKMCHAMSCTYRLLFLLAAFFLNPLSVRVKHFVQLDVHPSRVVYGFEFINKC